MTTGTWLLLILVFIFVPVGVSLLVEAVRTRPPAPETLYWSKDIPISYLHLDGTRIRYIKAGQGPALVLLHTLRTQLDIFEKIIPELTRNFTVYALDYPGHGYSDIVQHDYVPELFVSSVERFLDALDIEEANLAGISIGGSIGLLMAAKHNPRVKRVIAINPYDYHGGMGVTRGNFLSWLIFTLMRVPVLGETVMRFRNRMVETIILRGGVADPKALTSGFLEQVWNSGVRKGHYRAFINLMRHAAAWEAGHQVYAQIAIPVLLIYGDTDWSTAAERERTFKAIPGARMETVANGGHFLSLDQPAALIQLIRAFGNS